MTYTRKLKSKEYGRNKRIYNSGGSSSSSSIGGSGVGGSFLDQYFKFDTVNDILIANKSLVSEKSLIAYYDNGTIPTIWDGAPKASTTDFGVVRVGSGFNVNQGVISLDQSVITPQTLSLTGNDLSISNGNTVDLSSLSPDLTGYATESYVNSQLTDYITSTSLNTTLAGYEPIITTKNSAFNKSFAGTGSASTISRSDHNHNSTYHPIYGNTSTAFSASQLTIKSGLFTYDAIEDEIVINKNVRIQGNVLGEGSVTAYASNSSSSTIWDGAPIASYTDKGILSVNQSSPLTISNGQLSLNSTAIDPTLSLNSNILSVNGSSIDLSSISTDLTDYYNKNESDFRYALKGGSSTTDFKVKNLNVYGELTFIQAETIPIEDAFIKLNNDGVLTDSGIKIDNGTDDKARVFYQASTGKWVFGDDDVYNKIASEEWVSANYSSSTHTHDASDITSGIFNKERVRNIRVVDNRGVERAPNYYTDASASFAFNEQVAGATGWKGIINVKGWTGDTYYSWQLLSSCSTSTDNQLYFRTGAGNTWGTTHKIWHSGNDGSGSGLDADTLDTYHASSFPRKSENATVTGGWTFNNDLVVNVISDGQGIRIKSSGYGVPISFVDGTDLNNAFHWRFNRSTSELGLLYGQSLSTSNTKAIFNSSGHLSLGKSTSPIVPLDVNGKGRFAGQDSGKQIQIGGITGDRSTSMGVVTVTNGNLHLDSANGYKTYINYYTNTETEFGGSVKIKSQLSINDSNTKILEGSNNSVKVQTNSGYLELGPQNTTWCHMYSDRRFIFNQGVYLIGGALSSYDTSPLNLQYNGSTKLEITNSTRSYNAFNSLSKKSANSRVVTEDDDKYYAPAFTIGATGGSTASYYYKIASWTQTGSYQSTDIKLAIAGRTEQGQPVDYTVTLGFETNSSTGTIGNTFLNKTGYYFANQQWFYKKNGTTIELWFRKNSTWKNVNARVISHYGYSPTWSNTGSSTAPSGLVESYSNIISRENAEFSSNITASGTIKAYSTSDQRLKENIQPLTSSIDTINKINTYSFDYNSVGKELMCLKSDEVYDTGVIAQELEQIPELQHVVGDIYDEYKGVKYERLIPHLIKAVQELSKEVNELKKK
ncbi:tail fiber domain-containing protein [Carboxylicivirga sp. RSCT41]|uniref:tail fiber domain-containing protein n=1 Tax=Carboxylicivirga agarovorans TaxID=3417570 RepID=UPI003D346A0B